MRFSLAFEFGSLSHATHFMRVSLTIRIQVSIPHYSSVLVFCMMDIWMFSLGKLCRHASRRVLRLRLLACGGRDNHTRGRAHFRGKGVPHMMFGVFRSMRYNLGNSSLTDLFGGPHSVLIYPGTSARAAQK